MSITPENVREAEKKLRTLQQRLGKALGRGGDSNERARQRMAEKRAAERDIVVPPPENPRRRALCLDDPLLFMCWYFPDLFYHPFTKNQAEIVEEFTARIQYGGKKAVAADRGGGKSTITCGLVVWSLLKRLLLFPFVIAANDTKAKQLIGNVKSMLRFSDRLMADFPLPCMIARALGAAPNRANALTVHRQNIDVSWSASQIVFPVSLDHLGEPAIMAATGITGGTIRGQNYGGQRPDFVLLDDLDTRKSAESVAMTEDIENTIEEDVTGLGGPGKILAVLMLCTVLNRRCIAWRYTDPSIKPAWRGRRFRLIVQMPDDMEAWEQYLEKRIAGMSEVGDDGRPVDPEGREAHQFYRDNREAMDAGSAVANPYRAIRRLHSDGEPLELSTLEHCFNRIADASCIGIDGEPVDGWHHFATEYQNDPPEEDEPQESGISPDVVANSLNGYAERVIPHDTIVLTGMIDVHKRHLTCSVMAWNRDGDGRTVHYFDVLTHQPDMVGPEEAIAVGLRAIRDQFEEEPYRNDDGEPVGLDLVLVDAGYQPGSAEAKNRPDYSAVVYEFVKESGHPFRASRGMHRFRMPNRGEKGKKRGRGGPWYESRQESRLYVINFDPSFFKHVVHERYLMGADDDGARQPGAFTVWGEVPRIHKASFFADQVAAQVYVEEWTDKGWKREWRNKPRARDDHYLDTQVGAVVAACVCGIPFDSTEPLETQAPAKRTRAREGFVRGLSRRPRSGGFVRKRK